MIGRGGAQALNFPRGFSLVPEVSFEPVFAGYFGSG